MKVLVIGASGFIGLPVAQAFVRAGHEVYGVTRSPAKAKELAVEEIIPIVAETTDPSPWVPLVATLDLIIDAVGGADVRTLQPALFSATVAAAQQHRPAGAPKLAYICTSGTWVHGESRTDIVTDTTPISRPVAISAWRPPFEQAITASSALDVVVIRPSLVYGRSGSILARLFRSAHQGRVRWFGTPGGRYSVVHTDDLAALYVLVGEKVSLLAGKIFDAANDATESVDDLLQKLVLVSRAQGYDYVQATNAFDEAITTTTLIRPYLGRALVGWQPRKAGLVDQLEVYYNSWKASEALPSRREYPHGRVEILALRTLPASKSCRV
ncbi:uncharacterized protein FIBRA_06854 [Fibroporia radiculosa]|uniref:NAD-dependent epimerase/dehydratase domain-containing protein n=1 Tax=Fibroporia radiculosa TaxID=599839 RepID=J4GCP5_9APHY|nr:uncharacterized protein FIBRA_06854 [Fibroporia radiculosa]CCM04668.1 predicted protein [Fibroporia radiculosa]